MGWLVLLAACSGPDQKETGLDLVGPELTHTAPASPLAGTPVTLSVGAVDPDGLDTVSLYWRVQGDADWLLAPMVPGDAADTYEATLDGDDVDAPGLEYYFKAVDAGETPATSWLPADNARDPFLLPVTVQGAPLPFVEDFELGEGEAELTALGWNNYSGSFRGYPWQLSDARAWSGATAAFHPRGYEGTDRLEDWLISPAIDLSAVSDAQVTWREYGSDVGEARHRLYVSVGSRNPEDGDYVELAAPLPAPLEGEWSRSAVYDLTPYVGSAAVYLAWYFEGVEADDWYIDDVRVETVQADLDLDWVVDPSPVHAGESATLTVTVTNRGGADADGATLDLSFPDGGVTVSAPVDVGPIPSGSAATVDLPLVVDAGAADPGYLPMILDLAWGEANALTVEDRFLVGEASVARVEWASASDGNLSLTLGVGNPDSPSWSDLAYAGAVVTGSTLIEVDITDQAEWLPPGPGGTRWWLEASGEAVGEITSFTITHLGLEYAATVFPEVGDDVVCWLPEPPALSVSASTSPTTLSPGTAGATVTFTVQNTGASTSGPLTAVLVSTDPDVTVTDPGPVAVTAGALGQGASAVASGFAFDVSAAHLDSSDVALELEVSDGVEAWSLPLSFDVPWPVFRVTTLEVDDDGRDGIVDAGEEAELTFTLTNVGDLASSGTVTGTLALASGSVATATVSTAAESFGVINAGASRDADAFMLTDIAGNPGDVLALELTLVDTARTYVVPVELTLGEPPWQALTTDFDDIGDALDGWDFDFVDGDYRVVGDRLQLRLHSATAYDASSLFIEAWGQSTSADYLYYRIVLQSGVANLQGYDASTGFHSLEAPTVSYPDADTVQLDVPVAAMGLFLDQLELGFGTGWCGEPEYYCDHWPDGWGYPYDSFSTASWFGLTW